MVKVQSFLELHANNTGYLVKDFTLTLSPSLIGQTYLVEIGYQIFHFPKMSQSTISLRRQLHLLSFSITH
jgi:hypothetical protein